MWWISLWAVVTIAGVCGVVASANAVRFERRVAREVREMPGSLAAPLLDRRQQLVGLPEPVRRYLARAVGDRPRAIQTVRLRHGGTFRPSLDRPWVPIRGEQHFTADPPGFIWWGRARMFPGLWVDARDRSTNGAGSMFVTMESTFTLADSRGPQLDQAALIRLLAELTWMPTAFLDGRYVRWSAVDDRRASATLEVNGRAVTAVFDFGLDNLPATFSANRYGEFGGKVVMTPFVGRFNDYRAIDGVLIPQRVIAAWVIDGTSIDYARFDVQRVEFDGQADQSP